MPYWFVVIRLLPTVLFNVAMHARGLEIDYSTNLFKHNFMYTSSLKAKS